MAVHPYKGQLGVIKTPGTFACDIFEAIRNSSIDTFGHKIEM